jgi:hypothetical protein
MASVVWNAALASAAEAEPVAWLDKSGPGPLSVRISGQYDYGCALPHDTKFYLHPAPIPPDMVRTQSDDAKDAARYRWAVRHLRELEETLESGDVGTADELSVIIDSAMEQRHD